MAGKLSTITGATGLLGSHIAEALIERGQRVRALVRSSSDVAFLEALGVERAVGDLHDPEALRRAFDGAGVVYHCAAHVGDWGPWSAFQRNIIDGTAHVLEACRVAGVDRILHVSSVTVYGHPRDGGELIREHAPLGEHLFWFWDYYCRAKIAAEELARSQGSRVTIVRPSWIYGPRDRTTLPRLIRAFRANRVRLIGSGDNRLNVVYAADVADGAIRAASASTAAGQAFNLCSDGELTQRQFVDLLTEALARPRVSRHLPFWAAYAAAFVLEAAARAVGQERPPHLTRYAVGLVGRPTRFSMPGCATSSAGGPRSAPAKDWPEPWPGGTSASLPGINPRKAPSPPRRRRTSRDASGKRRSHRPATVRAPPGAGSLLRPARRGQSRFAARSAVPTPSARRRPRASVSCGAPRGGSSSTWNVADSPLSRRVR